MAKTEDRFMMLLVLFDLPTTSKKERNQYSNFRKFLKQDGFMMLQFSVYGRICKGQDAINKHLKRVKFALPNEGNVRCLQITDKQYGRMETLVGKVKKEEQLRDSQLILL